MNILDKSGTWAEIDVGNMYSHIRQFPEQVEAAIKIGQEADLGQLDRFDVDQIVVAGLGGSAIGGDLARSYLAEWLEVPMLVVRDYVLPNFVGERTLVIVSSYSGNTEETLSAYSQAQAVKANILVFTSGGELARRAAADGFPVVAIPGGLMPRAALGYSFFPLLMALARLGFCPDQASAIEETRKLLGERIKLFSSSVPQAENPAKQAAVSWQKHLPVIYAGNVRFDAVALRIKCQIAENAKQLAFANVFPEFNHNELVGYGKLEHLAKLLTVCIVRDAGDHRRTGFRMAIVRKMIADFGIPVAEVETVGQSPLARMFSVIQWGDFASYYLAILNGVDPTPIAAIDHLKAELAER
jgi:glucose/mannose-6-phosphate isomerase